MLGVGQHGDQFVLVEILGRDIARKALAHLGGKFRVFQPLGNRHRETLLRAVGPGVRQGLVGGGAQHGLGIAAQLVAVGVALGLAQDLTVQIGHAQLQTMGHAHLVGLQKNIAGQPEVQIEVLLLFQLAQILHAVIDRRGDLAGGGADTILRLQDVIGVLFLKDMGLPNEPVLRAAAALDDKVVPLKVGQLLAHIAGQMAQRCGQALVLLHQRGVGVPLIAGVDLISALAGENDRDMLAGQLAQEVERHAGRVGLRLVHVILDIRKGVKALLLGQHLAVVLDAELVGKLPGLGRFVKFVGAVRAGKADREGLIGHQAGRDIAGIHAAGQEGADLDIADAVGGHALPHAGIDLVGALLIRKRRGVAEIRVPVPLDLHFAILVGEPVGRGQLVGALEERLVHGAVLEGQVGAQRLGVDLPAEAGVLQQALDFAAEQQLTCLGLGVVERLDAENITRAVHLVRLGIPHDKGEHAAQHTGQLCAVLLIAVQDDLSVAVGLEDVAFGLQRGAQLHKIVDLAVEHADNGAVLIVHGLFACGQVDDAQTAEAQRDGAAGVIAADMVALHIGAAVDDAVCHSVQDGLALFTQAGKANKATHGNFPFVLSIEQLDRILLIYLYIVPQMQGKEKYARKIFSKM